MRKKNLKLKTATVAALSFLIGIIAAAFGLWVHGAEPPLTAEAKIGSNVVGELYSNTSSTFPFSQENLDALAQKAGYSDINDMVTKAKNGEVKTAADMTAANSGTEWSVTLGGLTWNPMYLSKDNDGNAILTLWQADATIASTWSDGTYSTNSTSATKSWTENGSYPLYSNSYDGSFVRNYLNGKTTYLSSWGSGSNTANKNTAISTTFAAFRSSGNIGDYVVSPSKVRWQTSLSTSWKNDASYSPVSGASNAGTAANYPKNWLNDKLWLPSIHETYDGTASNTTSLSRRDTSGGTTYGGLWQTSATQRGISNTSVASYSWLRSGNYSTYITAYGLNSSGGYTNYYVSASYAVRPALHLNLTSAAGATAETVVEELFSNTSSTRPFSKDNLNALAKKAGYMDINAMVTAAQNGTVMTAADMTTANDGVEWSITLGGLVWNPMYLSKDSSGNAILTLWLGSNSSTLPYSNGTYSSSSTGKTYTENGIDYTVYSNTYDGSFIRHYILNGDNNYTTAWGSGTAVTESDYSSIQSTFAPFRTSGNIGDYVVSPSKVSWQTDEANWRNDPSSSQVANYPANWTNDKLWLPSLYEVYDTTDSSSVTLNNGLWGTSATQRSNSTNSWLRSGNYSWYNYVYTLNSSGACSNYSVDGSSVVRPALHLNLTATLGASISSELTLPSDLGTDSDPITYDGTSKKVEDMANLPDWYDSEMTFTYKNKKDGATVEQVTEAGEYSVTATLTDGSTFTTGDTTATFTLTVSPKTVSVTGISASDKTYDGTTSATLDFTNAAVSGAVQGDNVSVDTTAGTGTFASKDVGTHSVAISGITLTGNDAGNYTLSSTTATTTANITAATVTVTGGITANNKTYDGNTTATFVTTGATVTGVKQGDTVTVTATGTFDDKNAGTGKTVTITSLVLGGADASNYALATTGNQSSCTADITPKQLTVTINAGGGVYGGNITEATATLGAGYLSGEQPTVTLTYTCSSPAYNSTTVPTEAGTYTVTASIPAGNYELTGTTSASFVISVGGNSVSVSLTGWTYGDTPNTPTVTASFGGDTATYAYYSDSACTQSIGAPTSTTPAGTYYVKATVAATGSYDGAEAITSFTISKKEITVSGITANNKTYDGNTTATLNYSAVVYGGIVQGDTLSVTATGAFDNKNVGTGKTVNITGLTLGGTSVGNYTLATTGQQTTCTADITAKSVSVTGITASNKEYDGGTTATLDTTGATFDGIISGDSLSVTATGAFADKNVGTNKTVNITLSALGGTSASNYTLATTGNQSSCTADITAKSVSVTGVSASDKTYDGTTSATLHFTNAAVYGAVQGDGVSVDTTAGTGTFDNKNVGANKTVNITGITLTGTDAGNYTLATTTATANATITAATVTVTGGITANNKTYDGNTTATFDTTNATFGGIITGDSLSVTATGAFADKNAGTGKTVTISNITLGGADASNYVLATTGNQTSCTADITPKQLTVTINAGGGVYGGNITAATATLGAGYLSGEQPTVTLTYTCSSPAYNSTTVPTEAGTYTVTATIPAGNYALTGDTSASFVISAGGNSVSVSLTGWTYGETPNTPTVTASFGGSTATYAYYSDSACTQSIGAPTSTTPAGTYYVKATIAATGSYDSAEAITSFTISKKEITFSGIAANNKTYDGNTAATLNYSAVVYGGIVAGDDLSVTATGTFADKNVGTGKTVNITGLTLGGTSVGNYILATTGQQTSCTADITAAEITVTGITASGKTYDGTTSADLNYSAVTYTGIVAGDSLSVTATGAFDNKNVGTGKTVNITNITLSGTSVGNYILATTGNQTTCTADITAAEITISGIAANGKDYDGNTAASLDYSAVVYGGIAAGDSLSVTATGTYETASAGYGKTVNITSLVLGGADASNYVLAPTGQQTSCTADVIGKEVTVTGIAAESRQYDGTTEVTFDYSGVRIEGVTAGDEVSVVAVGAFESADVGADITVNITSLTLVGADSANYMLAATGNQTSCTADITRREITVTVTADDHDAEEVQAATATLNNVVADEEVKYTLAYTGTIANGTPYSSAEAPTEKGEYKVTISIDESVYTNYVLTGAVEKTFIITQTVSDENGNEVDIPIDGDFDFVVTQTPTNDNYDYEGISIGYSARLWVLAEDGTASAEYRESVRCNIIFKVPETIADEILRSGKTLPETQADGDLLLYAATDGESLSIDEYKLYFDMSGTMYVRFSYEGSFPAEIIFNAPNVVKETQKSSGIPWWVWLIVALAAIAVIGVVVVIIVVVKKKNGDSAATTTTTTVVQGEKFDDSDIQRRLTDLENRDDGGFMDPYDGE